MMICNQVELLLSDFTDETLEVSTAWQVQTHLAGCTACTKVSRNLLSMRQALQALPTRHPSNEFDAKLAQRLALTRRPPLVVTSQGRLAGIFRTIVLPTTGRRLRPVLALGFALTAIAAAIWVPRYPGPTPDSSAVRLADKTFVADCVAQHRRAAAAEPLADLAAQNLAGNLDTTPASYTYAPKASDTGLY
jgi:anti-sigma factor RsiW